VVGRYCVLAAERTCRRRDAEGATLCGYVSVSSAVLLGDKQATVLPWKGNSMARRLNAQSSLLSAVMTALDAVRTLAVEGIYKNILT
jgi:hypothetical protein